MSTSALPEQPSGEDTGDKGAGMKDRPSIYAVIQKSDTRLEECLDAFWSAAIPIEDLLHSPPLADEPFALLKKLGSSPFDPGGFPIIGFFATAYERVSRLARTPDDLS